MRLRRFAGPVAYRDQVSHIRVAHLTDQHVGRITPFEVQMTAVEMTNAEKPDLVLISGDFVCHSQAYLDQLTELMQAFQAPVLAVLGNHDHWSGAAEVRHALQRGGVEVLSNRNTTLTIRNERLQVVGLDDAYTGHARREEAVKGLRRDLPVIALSHIAKEADGLWRHGIPLVLSGHTHGGQVTLARLHELAVGIVAGHKYVHGLYGSRLHANHRRIDEPPGAVYVGAGIGAAVVPSGLGSAAGARSRCSSSVASRAISSSTIPSRSRWRDANRPPRRWPAELRPSSRSASVGNGAPPAADRSPPARAGSPKSSVVEPPRSRTAGYPPVCSPNLAFSLAGAIVMRGRRRVGAVSPWGPPGAVFRGTP